MENEVDNDNFVKEETELTVKDSSSFLLTESEKQRAAVDAETF